MDIDYEDKICVSDQNGEYLFCIYPGESPGVEKIKTMLNVGFSEEEISFWFKIDDFSFLK